MKKTVLVLEDKLKSRDFTLSVYEQELKMLRDDKFLLEKLQVELAELKNQKKLTSLVQYALSATTKEVEELLNRNEDRQTLAVLAATFKRELKSSEAKKQEMRDRMKTIQNELSDERSKTRTYADKLSFAENEMHRLEQEVKKLEKLLNSREDEIPNTPEQTMKRKRVAIDLNKSTPMSEKVEKITQSDSPYFDIQSCSIGLVPLLRPGMSASARFGKCPTETSQTSSTQDDLSKKFSIFRKPRLATTYSLPMNKNLVYNGLGGSEKKENFPGFPEPKQSASTSHIVKRIGKTSSSSSARLKTGQLKKPSAQGVDSNETLIFLNIPLDD
ncbi:uncharacterized protein LOC129765395 isoform X2 [Toxorhynchites rutilus septentrionalis]|nr:uncharacterized protein LOC129765395 isoform X2 [Toxorhynchites rutilus septentrionalis]